MNIQDKARKFRKDLHKSYNKHQFHEAEMLEQILEAEIHLVDLEVVEEELLRAHPSSYAGVYGHFCELNFELHKEDPAAGRLSAWISLPRRTKRRFLLFSVSFLVPMFRDLVGHSPDCQGELFKADLKKVAELARHRDQQARENNELVPKPLNLTTVAFHESRCGSTLVANSLLAMNPGKHRTYSESQPGAHALKSICGESYSRCSMDQAAKILQDTVYVMSRTNDPIEERVFYKFQSITSKHIKVFQKAFPEVPWLFIYRDPVQVMMSHIKDDPTMQHAKCVYTQNHNPPDDIIAIAERHGRKAKQMPKEEYCAAHLAAITESAVNALNDYAIPINYDGLIEFLYTKALPRIWGRPLTSQEISNIQKVSQTYSKGRGKKHTEFQGDSEQKDKAASEQVRDAAALILKESYDALEDFEPKLLQSSLPE